MIILNQPYYSKQKFEHIDFTEHDITGKEFEDCEFVHCNFSKSNLTDTIFSESSFTTCNLSMAEIANTAIRDVRFRDCKMLGLHFEHVNEFVFTPIFKNCILNMSSFTSLTMKNTTFVGCSLREVDFSDVDATGTVFDDCDLLGATFSNTTLEKADFRTAKNYSINPEQNKLKKARFSVPGVVGLLDQFNIIVE